MIRYCLLYTFLSISLFTVAHVHDDKKVVLQFHENKGQWPAQVLYRALTPGGAVFVEKGAFTYLLHQGGPGDGHGQIDHTPMPLQQHAFKVHFEGGNTQAWEGGHKMAHYSNYFLGNDPAAWGTSCSVYGEVNLLEVYPGIDLRVDGQTGMKYDWHVAAGADPGNIHMRYEGQEALYVEGGLLFIKTSVGNVIEQRPVAWQVVDGVERAVQCQYHLKGDSLTFALPDGYDNSLPLVIDPVVVFSSYSGSTGDNWGVTATYDGEGHLYGGGYTLAMGYPVTTGVIQPTWAGGFCDMSISKFSPDGSDLVWSTYIGGSQTDIPHSMVVNSAGELYILGSTGSSDFPTSAGSYLTTFQGGPFLSTGMSFDFASGSDIVVIHLNATATGFVGSTFVGGTDNDGLNPAAQLEFNYGDIFRGEIILDLNEDPIVATVTHSMDLFTSTDAPQSALVGGQDAYVFRMDPALSTLQWATYLGGAGQDAGYSVQVSSTGEIYMTGGTTSIDMPVTAIGAFPSYAGVADGYLVRFSADGSQLLSGTFIGTAQYDQSFFVQLDTEDNAYVVGQTAGLYPVTPGKYANPEGAQFIHKFSPDLTTSIWSTRIGGIQQQFLSPSAFLVSYCGQIYFSGWGGALLGQGTGTVFDLPVTPDAFQSTTDGSDFYLMMLQPDATDLGYATYFGGSFAGEHVDGGTSRFDKNGIVYQAVCAGCGGNSSFPTTPGAWSNTNNSSNCNLGVFKIDFEQSVQADIQVTPAQVTVSGITVCLGESLIFNAFGNANTWFWDLGVSGPMLEGAQVEQLYDTAGLYTIVLVWIDTAACNFADTATVSLIVAGPADLQPSFEAEPSSTCQGYNVTLENTSTGSTSFIWDFGDGTTGTDLSPTHFYQLPGEYDVTLYILDPICLDTALLTTQIILDPPQIELDMPSPIALCDGDAVQLNAGAGFTTYIWSTGQFTPSITVQQPGTYSVTVNDGICTGADTVQVVSQPFHAPAADITICPGMASSISPTFPTNSIIWNTGDTSHTISPLESGEYWFFAIDSYGCEQHDTITVTVATNEQGLAFIPNVFSPNGDQQNDQFQVSGLSLEQFSMEVYNRWGQMMYETTNPVNGWNGGLENSANKVPDGTYFYIITYKDRCSMEPVSTHHGHVTLVR
ncbi:MAG: gliding motility-associated C-terminal domain-containing protein [Bacteroidota bacterium]|nr:gliding motility-associated C-terminal domain-containing protein [Bacteroidota bacterium]